MRPLDVAAQSTQDTNAPVVNIAGVWPSQEAQILYLRQIVIAARAQPEIRRLARDVVFRQFGCAPNDQRSHALALASWVQRNVRYVQEIPEVLQTPAVTIAEGYGDCDDQATTLCALLEAVGIPSYLFAIGGWAPPDRYSHIYCVAELDGPELLPLDTTLSTDLLKQQRDPLAEMRARYGDVNVFVG